MVNRSSLSRYITCYAEDLNPVPQGRDTAEVIEAAREAVSAMTQAFDLALADTAERISAETGRDARVIRPHLRKLKEAGLAAFRSALTKALAAEGGTPVGPGA